MNRIIIAATLVALTLVLFGCAGTDNGNAAPANPGQVNAGAQGAPSPDNGSQVGAAPPSAPSGGQGYPIMAGNNSSVFGGTNLTNVSQADSDPTAGLISNEDVPSPPS